MSRPLLIASPSGTRRLGLAELPVRIGRGARMDIRVPGSLSETIVGLISVLDDRPLLQRSADEPPLLINGEPLAATRWLADGDVITVESVRIECHFDAAALRLLVAYTDTEYPTLPPVLAATPDPAIASAPRPVRATPATARRSGLSWTGYAAFAVLLAVAAYIFTARSVGVVVAPPGAKISLAGGWLPFRVGGRYLLRPGAYEVHAATQGYQPLTAKLRVTDEPRQNFKFTLQKLPGRLRLVTDPGVRAELTVDGKPAVQGTPATPGEFTVPAGEHVLGVLAPRYQPFEARLMIEGRDQLQQLVAHLTPNWADVTLTSRPAGAAILVDGELAGTTTATLPIEAGSRQIEVRKDGFKIWRQVLIVAARQRLELPPVDLVETDALLEIITVPAGAAITLDGRFRGATPLDLEVTPGRAHQLLLAKPGFETVTRPVEVQHRATQTVRIELAPRVGVVRLSSSPADAELYVDGERRGVANQELTLSAVAHRIEVRKAGYASYQTEVAPAPGLPQVLEVKLLTPEQAVVAATPRTVTTSQGLVMRLVAPGRLQMGAPRHEQGRRPNETEHSVILTRKFFIGTREITNREYREFKPSHTSGAEKYQELSGTDHPAVMMSWEDAVAFCNWLSDRESMPRAYVQKDGQLQLASPAATGYRLPTEAEWEWVSRYNGGGGARRYPWGDHMPPEPGSGNFADQSAKGLVPNVLQDFDDDYPVTAPVGKFTPSPLGIYDLGGNAAEWTNDVYTVYVAGAAEATDPTGAGVGQYHVIRGSSWRHSSISELRFAYRDFGDQGRLDVGFRIARYAE